VNFFGQDLKKEEIKQKIGDISQLGGIKYYEFIDGTSRGVRGIDIKCPSGLDMTILPDRGMDISKFSYYSIPIAWRSAIRETSPLYYDSRGLEWSRTFFGGLITTCGLTYMGFPCTDEGKELGLHGRITNISAENVLIDGEWDGNSYKMWAQGKVREADVFGDKLELTRKITTWMDSTRIIVEDCVENIGNSTSPIMLLYHVNIGYPIIDSCSKLLESKAFVTPRDEEAEKGLNSFNNFSEPVKGFKEQVYFHDIEADEDGNANIALVNEEFNNGKGIGIWLKYNKNNLPYLIQWKQMGIGEYVCGIEPANSYPRGRAIEKKREM